MFRRAALATFAAALLLVVACGREITPEPNLDNGNLAGHLDIRFRVNGMLAFSTYDYQIAIDACGGGAPLPNPGTTSTVKNYSYSFNVGTSPYGVGSASIASPVLFQYKLLTGLTGFTPLQVPLDPSLFSFVPDSDGTGATFELVFARSLLDNPEQLAQPCPNFTEPPSSALRAAQAAPGDAPLLAVAEAATVAPSASPTAAPSATPAPQPTTPVQATWIVNFIVLTPSGVPVDSLGPGGPSDNQFAGIAVNTQTQEDIPVNKIPDTSPPTDQSAAIAGGEIDNYP